MIRFERIAYSACVALFALGATLVAANSGEMVASFYGSESGTLTASGRRFRPHEMTAAHKTLPFGTRLRVCYRGCVVVIVTDRGPFIRGRELDLSSGAAKAIGMQAVGVARVKVDRL